MIGIYNYTVYLTYASLASGVLGIHSALRGKLGLALIFLMLSGFFDLFDGIVARTKQRNAYEKRYGVQIDSLVDVVSFGVLPAIIGYKLGLNNWIGVTIIILYILAAIIRLAHFNCLTEETDVVKGFVGLPVTSSALIFPAIYLLKPLFGKDDFKFLYAAVMIVVFSLFVSKIRIKKPNKKGIIIMFIFGLLMALVILLRVLKMRGKI